jgi:cell division septation protein DedD
MRQANLPGAAETASRFDMRAFMRLALWGLSASTALLLAVLASDPQFTSPRLVALAAWANRSKLHEAGSIPRLDREDENRRLAETVRGLSADREILLRRVSALEQSLADVTGSIRGQAMAARPLATAPVAAPPSAPVDTSTTSLALPRSTAAIQPRRPAVLPAIEGRAEAAPSKPKAEFALDLGSAVNFDALRVLFNATKAGHAPLLDGLTPLVVPRINPRSGSVELHLLIGPVADAETAARLCSSLTIAPRTCQPAPFEGQQLALAGPDLDSKPQPLPDRRPARLPAPPPRPPARP